MCGCRPENRDPFRLASLAAFRFVLELFVMEKQLFSGRKDEVRATIHTLQNFVLEFHRENAPFSPIAALSTCGGGSSAEVEWQLVPSPSTCTLGSARPCMPAWVPAIKKPDCE